MRRISLILLLLGMLLAVGIVEAQETTDEFLEVQYLLPSTDFMSDEIHDLMTRIENRMLLYGIDIEFVEYQIPFSTNTISFLFSPTNNRNGEFVDIYVSILTYNQNLLRVSPILVDVADLSVGSITNPLAEDYAVAALLYVLGRNELAEEMLISFIDENQTCDDEARLHNRELNYLLGNIKILQEDYSQAAEYLECASGDLRMPQPTINLAWTYIQLGRTEEAFTTINSLIEPAREDGFITSEFTYLKVRAQLYALVFDYDSSIADINEAIRLAEEHDASPVFLARLYTVRGQIIFLLYEWDNVLADFNHAIELDPSYAPAYFERGVLYYTMTQRENALADFEHYLELDPDGLYAEEATQYIDSIEIELEALGG